MFQRITQLAAEGLRYSADLILPPVCVSCSALITRHNLLCPRCWSGMNLITPPFCERLGIPLPAYEGAETHISMQALANPPVFLRARAAAHYGGIIRRLIVRFKFEDKHEPLPLFIKLMRRGIREPQDLGKIGLTTLFTKLTRNFICLWVRQSVNEPNRLFSGIKRCRKSGDVPATSGDLGRRRGKGSNIKTGNRSGATGGAALGLSSQDLRYGPCRFRLHHDKNPGRLVAISLSTEFRGEATQNQRFVLGKAGHLTPDSARKAAQQALGAVAKGRVSQAAKQAERARADGIKFEELIGAYFDFRDDGSRYWSSARALYRREVPTVLGARAATLITRADLRRMLDKTRAKSPNVERWLYTPLNGMFRWAIERGHVASNPAADLTPPAVPPSRDRVLSEAELALVLRASAEMGAP